MCSCVARLSEDTAGVLLLLSLFLRDGEGQWRTACVRFILHVLDAMEDMRLPADATFVLREAAEIQPYVPL